MKKITYIPSKRETRDKKRVAAYCRVSTGRDDQADSFEMQTKYYNEYIHSNPEWEFAGIYADKGISGTDAKNRPEFQKMVTDALDGKIDLILCKSISRFSRNLLDCTRYVQMLYGNGVEIKFEKEGIFTADPSAFLMFGMMATIAQSESESISRNEHWVCQKKFENGEYNIPNNRILGYSNVDGKIVPNEDAWVVKMIFDLFLKGYTYKQIALKVREAGVIGLRGKPFSVATVKGMLRNETYVGDKLLQKNPPNNYLTHRPDPNVEYNSYYVTNGHEAIIDRDTWNKVQAILQERKECIKKGFLNMPGRSHFLYGKLFCGRCGAPYKRTNAGNKEIFHWACKERIKGKRGNGCKGRYMKEEVLFKEISTKLGWEWNGVDAFNQRQDQINKIIDHIIVYDDRLEIVRKEDA
jgi:site-specific DNA recombinase